ncbi:hypothetical protein [Halomicrococcus gelatinilyticus]|uniref:hypothetical protein n=1 Tax=Halomicrococcus gelatinilyticus TaxID=1702103 RepID=UPI002E14E0A9
MRLSCRRLDVNEDDEPLLEMGTGGLAVLFASAVPAVNWAVGVGSETFRTAEFLLLDAAAVVIWVRWTPSG